jgi:hypothetical protein
MKQLEQVAAFLKTTHGIITTVIALGAVGSSYFLRHDANVIRQFNEKNKQEIQMARIEKWIKLDSLQAIEFVSFSIKYNNDKEEAVDLGNRILKKITVLDTAVDNHLRKSKDANEYINWLKNQRIQEEKKNYDSELILREPNTNQ